MRIEAVHRVEQRRIARPLLGQVGRAAAAEQQHVDVAAQPLGLALGVHRRGQHGCDRRRVAAGEDARHRHIGVLCGGQVRALPQIAVAHNAYTNLFHM